MEANRIRINSKNRAFDTAKENMAFDESLLLNDLEQTNALSVFIYGRNQALHTVINNNAPRYD